MDDDLKRDRSKWFPYIYSTNRNGFKMKKILITGSDGLIGSNLSKYLLNKKYYVIGIDDQSRYGNVVREHHNLDNFSFIKDSILNVDLSQIVSDVDTVIHCAYHAGGINYWNHNEDQYYKKIEI